MGSHGSQEEQLFADSVEDFLRHEYTFSKRQELLSRAVMPFDRQLWRRFGELGWLALSVPEVSGGLEQPVTSAMSLMATFGRHLVLEPYVTSVLVPVSLLTSLGSGAASGTWLEAIGSGSSLWAWAHEEMGMRSQWKKVQCEASPSEGGVILNGMKTQIPWGGDADVLLVSAREGDGLSLFMIDAETPGLEVHCYPGSDDVPLADFHFRELFVPIDKRIGGRGDASAAIDDAMYLSLAATCHQAVGALTQIFALTLDYAKLRRQFGQPIGNFQVIQHRLVDMYTSVELSRTMAVSASAHVGRDAPKRDLVLAAAKAQISASCRFVGEQAIQIHGGIGTTDECSASHYFRSLVVLEKKLGDRHHHLGVIANALAAHSATLHD